MLLRQKVWWPGIDAQVERLVKVCIPCQATGLKARPEPLLMTAMPEKPWQVVHIDLCGPFPTGEHVLGVVDECSRWPAVRLMKTVTTATVIEKLESVFTTHGIPEVIVSDNGPQFVSGEFRAFCETKGIRHRKVTPLWPAANAEIERFFRTLGKAVRTAHVEGRNWRREMFVFLLNYRSTPHCTTGVSPA
jgi:transposase InsO family protein